jgi:hypothetical protein
MASNGRVVNNELKRSWFISKYYPSIFPEVPRKTTKKSVRIAGFHARN